MDSEAERLKAVFSKRTDSGLYSMFQPAQLLAIQARERRLLKLLEQFDRSADLPRLTILEIGCGSGFWLREFLRWGARPENLYGIDVLPDRIAEAQKLCPPQTTLLCKSATELQGFEGGFDLVLQSTVFSSILDSKLRVQVARQMLRMLKPGGLVVWYDFFVDNPANPDVRGVPRNEIRELFPGCDITLQRVTLAPPIGRRVAPVSPALYAALSAVKALNTHYLGIIRPG
jgi:SAM-dependent methyltransferase